MGETVHLGKGQRQQFDFEFEGVDGVLFYALGAEVAIDDVYINERPPAPGVPDAGAAALLLSLGVMGLGALRRAVN